MSKSAGVALDLQAAEVERFRGLVVITTACHVWAGAVGSDGYGRFALRRGGKQRTVSPHLVAATLAFGSVAAGATLLHDCDVRICVRTDPGHVHIDTQQANAQQAAWRGRMNGPRPGLVDVRGPVGQSRAIQDALRASTDRDPVVLALVLADVLAAGDPLRDNLALFDLAGPDVATRGRDLFGDQVQ